MYKNLRFPNKMNSIDHNDFPTQDIACHLVCKAGNKTYTESQSHYENENNEEVSLTADCTVEILPADFPSSENKIAQATYKEIDGKDQTRTDNRRPGLQRPYRRIDVEFGTKEQESGHKKPSRRIAHTAEAYRGVQIHRFLPPHDAAEQAQADSRKNRNAPQKGQTGKNRQYFNYLVWHCILILSAIPRPCRENPPE